VFRRRIYAVTNALEDLLLLKQDFHNQCRWVGLLDFAVLLGNLQDKAMKNDVYADKLVQCGLDDASMETIIATTAVTMSSSLSTTLSTDSNQNLTTTATATATATATDNVTVTDISTAHVTDMNSENALNKKSSSTTVTAVVSASNASTSDSDMMIEEAITEPVSTANATAATAATAEALYTEESSGNIRKTSYLTSILEIFLVGVCMPI